MRVRFRAARCACGLLAMLVPACGGSSSETPPPERPDSWQLELRRPKAEASETGSKRSGATAQWGSHGRAVATWGKGGAPKFVPYDAGIADE